MQNFVATVLRLEVSEKRELEGTYCMRWENTLSDHVCFLQQGSKECAGERTQTEIARISFPGTGFPSIYRSERIME
jgi:hypothetical protein